VQYSVGRNYNATVTFTLLPLTALAKPASHFWLVYTHSRGAVFSKLAGRSQRQVTRAICYAPVRSGG
jgi:hypothetical protein